MNESPVKEAPGEELGYRRLPPTDRPANPLWVMIQNELEGVLRSQMARFAMIGILVFSLSYVGLNVYALEQSQPGSGHTMDSYLILMDLLRWGALVMAAVLAGPSLLDDARLGALELYLARPVRHGGYLLAKAIPTLGVVTLSMWVPALLYYLLSFFIFDANPDGWHATLWQSLGYAVLWAVPVTGAGFAISCLARSGIVAALWLFGSVFMFDILVADILSFITDLPHFMALSPLALHAQQGQWLYEMAAPHDFPVWWGAVGLAAIAVVGWGVMATRYPRLRGGES